MTQQQQQQVDVYTQLSTSDLAEGYSRDQIEMIYKSVAKDATATEFIYFLSVCKATDLNPIKKEIWCYGTGSNLTIFIGRDGHLKMAERNPDFLGVRSFTVYSNDTFEADLANFKLTHKMAFPDRGTPALGVAIVTMRDKDPIIKIRSFKDHDKGRNTWKNNPEAMIEKTAEKAALSQVRGATCSGLMHEDDYSAGDMVESEIEMYQGVEEMDFRTSGSTETGRLNPVDEVDTDFEFGANVAKATEEETGTATDDTEEDKCTF